VGALVVECPEATVLLETGTHEGAHDGHWPGVYTRRAREHGLAGDLVGADRDPGRLAAVRSGWT